MKTVILAGGLGTRISEETHTKPKPMITIGGMPIIWHIMKIYSSYGINDFIICSGYKDNIIKNYFEEFNSESWDIKTIDTGLKTNTGGRIKRIEKYIENETFCLSYGDDLKKVNISNLIDFHKKRKKFATMTVTKPIPRFGIVEIDENSVIDIKEKSRDSEKWINGGYFVLESNIFDFIKGDETVWEKEPLKKLVSIEQLSAFKYEDEYYPMDTLYDKNKLEDLWKANKAYWKI